MQDKHIKKVIQNQEELISDNKRMISLTEQIVNNQVDFKNQSHVESDEVKDVLIIIKDVLVSVNNNLTSISATQKEILKSVNPEPTPIDDFEEIFFRRGWKKIKTLIGENTSNFIFAVIFSVVLAVGAVGYVKDNKDNVFELFNSKNTITQKVDNQVVIPVVKEKITQAIPVKTEVKK